MENEQRELNLLGARVMGWPIYRTYAESRNLGFPKVWAGPDDVAIVYFGKSGESKTWNPCEDLNQAWEVFQCRRDQLREAVNTDEMIKLYEVGQQVGGHAWSKDAAMFLMRKVSKSVAQVALNGKEEVRDGANEA